MLSRAALPAPPSEGVEDFQLLILNPTATEVVSWFSANRYAGLGTEVAAALEPSGAGKTLTFTGRPELIKATGNEVVAWRVNDGSGWQNVFYGAVTTGWAARPSREPRQYVADASYLLNARVVDATTYGPQDPALIAADLIRRLRHPALNFTELDFPATGTTLEGGFEQPGITLGEALELLAQSVEDSSRRVDFGVDGRGYVFFRGGGGIAELEYREEDYRDLAVQAADTVTAVYWVIGNEPSEPGYYGGYRGGTLTHLSIPDAGLHESYGRVTSRVTQNASDLFVKSPAASYLQLNFNNPGNGIDGNTNSATQALSGQTNDPLYRVDPDQLVKADVYGVSITYRVDYDSSPPSMVLAYSQYVDEFYGGPSATQDVYWTLPYTNGLYTTKRYIITPHKNILDALGQVRTRFAFLEHARVGGGAGKTGHFSIADFHFLRLNKTPLDAAARRELRTPAREPATVTPRRDTPDGPRTYYVKPEPRVRLVGFPGNPLSPTAEWRIGYDPGQGVSTVIDLGNVAREDDEAALIEQLRLGIDDRTRRSEVRTTVGRL